MSEKLQIRYIATRSYKGKELCNRFVELAENQGHNVICPTPVFIEALHSLYSKDDVVIIDATRENNLEDHNYHIIQQSFFACPHIVLISRNYLPLNIGCLHETTIDSETNTVYENAPRYRGELSNDLLLKFLSLLLKDVPNFPARRSFSNNIILGVISDSVRVLTSMGFTLFGKYKSELNCLDTERSQQGQVFISFRNADSENVMRLKHRIETKQNNEFFPNSCGKAVRFFPPGNISDEIFTEWRRWNVLSWLDRFIGPADEFWIYKSKKNNGKYYFNSWWTLGEIMTIANLRHEGYRNKKNWRFRLYDEATDSVNDIDNDFFPALSDEQRKRLARWYVQTDAMQIWLGHLIMIVKMSPDIDYLPTMMAKNYIRDHVFSPRFWTDYILDCPYCRDIGENENHFDVDSLLWHKGDSFTRISYTEIEKAIKSDGVIRCRNKKCDHPKFLVERKEPHYLDLSQTLKEKDILMLREFFHDTSNDSYLLRVPNYKITSI